MAHCAKCSNLFDIPFTFAFQPIFNVKDGTVFAHEALVRGMNEESAYNVLSLVNPNNVHAFDQSCRKAAVTHFNEIEKGGYLSINFLPRAVYDPKVCIESTLKTCEKYQFPYERLIFEISEVEKTDSIDHLVSIINEYKSLGFKVAIDDFGSGYSNLDLLVNSDVDYLKIDMEIIKDCDKNPKKQLVLKHLVEICDDLNIEVIAEGVETESELNYLVSLGIYYIQGYLLSRPIFENVYPYHTLQL